MYIIKNNVVVFRLMQALKFPLKTLCVVRNYYVDSASVLFVSSFMFGFQYQQNKEQSNKAEKNFQINNLILSN